MVELTVEVTKCDPASTVVYSLYPVSRQEKRSCVSELNLLSDAGAQDTTWCHVASNARGALIRGTKLSSQGRGMLTYLHFSKRTPYLNSDENEITKITASIENND